MLVTLIGENSASESELHAAKQKILSLQEVGQKRKIVVKIEFTPLSLDRKIFPFKKGFKKTSTQA